MIAIGVVVGVADDKVVSPVGRGLLISYSSDRLESAVVYGGGKENDTVVVTSRNKAHKRRRDAYSNHNVGIFSILMTGFRYNISLESWQPSNNNGFSTHNCNSLPQRLC